MNAERKRAVSLDGVDPQWLKLRQLEEKVVSKLQADILSKFDEEELDEEFEKFLCGYALIEPDEQKAWFEGAFVPWMLFSPGIEAISSDESFLLEPRALSHATAKRRLFSTAEKQFIRTVCSEPLSFFVVEKVVPGRALVLCDVLLDREVVVKEQQASESLEPGSIIFTRVVTMNGTSIMIGCFPVALLPAVHDDILRFRSELEAAAAQHGDTVSKELIGELDLELRTLFFHLADGGVLGEGNAQEESGIAGEQISFADLPAELRGEIEKKAGEFWEKWYDEPVPALDNRTPRQAALTDDGRQRLEVVLRDLKSMAESLQDNVFAPNVDENRAALNLPPAGK